MPPWHIWLEFSISWDGFYPDCLRVLKSHRICCSVLFLLIPGHLNLLFWPLLSNQDNVFTTEAITAQVSRSWKAMASSEPNILYLMLGLVFTMYSSVQLQIMESHGFLHSYSVSEDPSWILHTWWYDFLLPQKLTMNILNKALSTLAIKSFHPSSGYSFLCSIQVKRTEFWRKMKDRNC